MSHRIRLFHYLLATCLIFNTLISSGASHPAKTNNSVSNYRAETAEKTGIGDTLGKGITGEISASFKTFRSVIVDSKNTKWFLTEQGILSFNGEKWILHNKNSEVPALDLKGFALEVQPNKEELWIASPKGATAAVLPVDGESSATTYTTKNAPILNNNVVRVAIGKNLMRWFGTPKGVSAVRDGKWLKADYDELYPEELFEDFPITAMATNTGGDSLYVATEGAGIARIYRNNVDAITGASVYAKWGPILLPSDKVYSILIASNNTQWFGTQKGLARHVGNNTLANWTVFSTRDGLADNFVQAIAIDNSGHIWTGTRGGVSVYDGSKWSSFTKADGLKSNNILCIAVDTAGAIWFGTDNGVNSYKDGKFISY